MSTKKKKAQMMAKAKLYVLSSVCLLFFTLSALAADEPSAQLDQVIETLRYIASGYETNADALGTLKLQGRIFHVQKAQEGRKIPDHRIMAPAWAGFEYIRKDGKRRYEEDMTNMPGKRAYALDNNKKMLIFAANVVRVYPLREEEARWAQITEPYNAFLRMSTAVGRENISRSAATLIEQIQAGEFARKDWNISVEADDAGLFKLRIKRKSTEEEYTIDGHKGFNLVESKFYYPSEKFRREETGQYEYTKLAGGQWVLKNAQVKGVEDGVVYERRLETAAIKTDFDAPDEIFEARSLNIPADIYTIDYSFSPPLELDRGATPDIDMLDTLIDSSIAENQIATIDSNGQLEVDIHKPYAERQAQDIGKAATKPVAVTRAKWQWFVIAPVIAIGIGVLVSVMIYRRSRGGANS